MKQCQKIELQQNAGALGKKTVNNFKKKAVLKSWLNMPVTQQHIVLQKVTKLVLHCREKNDFETVSLSPITIMSRHDLIKKPYQNRVKDKRDKIQFFCVG